MNMLMMDHLSYGHMQAVRDAQAGAAIQLTKETSFDAFMMDANPNYMPKMERWYFGMRPMRWLHNSLRGQSLAICQLFAAAPSVEGRCICLQRQIKYAS